MKEKINKIKSVKKKWIIIAAVVIVVVIVAVMALGGGSGDATSVNVATVQNGDIEVVVSYSGTIQSNVVKSYYSQLAAPVSQLGLQVGDRVKKGDVLYRYDEDELNYLKERASLSIEQSEGNYDGALQKNSKATSRQITGLSLSTINQRLDQVAVQMDALNAMINEKTARMQRTLTDLQKTAMDVDQNGVADSTDAAEGNDSPVDRNTDDGKKQMLLSVQESIADYQYALQYDTELMEWKRQLSMLTEEKARLTEAASAEVGRITSGEKTALEAQKEISSLDNFNAIDNIEDAEDGVKAEFDGVVTEVAIGEGELVSKGAKIITITGTEDTRVDIQISKSDIGRVKVGDAVDITIGKENYTGKVSQISGTATKNSSGVVVVDAKISIDNPSDTIILGAEANTKIHTDKAENVIVIPYVYIGSDIDGDFVYVVDENNKVSRRAVTIGLSNNTDAQITDGLNVGDLVITDDPDSLSEGTVVKVM